MQKSMARALGACLAIVSIVGAGVAHGDGLGQTKVTVPHMMQKRPPYAFVAPDGFTNSVPAGGAADPMVFDASSATPLATMHAAIAVGVRATDQALVDTKANELVAAYPAAHSGMTAKIVKKELLTIAGTPVAHVVIEGAPVGKKSPKKKIAPTQREAHYYFGNTTHNAEVVYATDGASFTKLEPTFDASLRQTHGLAAPPAKPTPAASP